jgi:hypothetical protein
MDINKKVNTSANADANKRVMIIAPLFFLTLGLTTSFVNCIYLLGEVFKNIKTNKSNHSIYVSPPDANCMLQQLCSRRQKNFKGKTRF